jgi:hypothetical protein
MSTAKATLEKFVEDCKTLTGGEIYELFNDAEDSVREIVFVFAKMSGVNFDLTPEPTRASLIALGEHYGVQSLIDY